MHPRDRSLRQEFAITATWRAFIRHTQVSVDVLEAASHYCCPEHPAINPPQQGVLNAQ